MAHIHLLPATDQTLLDGWDALLLFDALLYARNLPQAISIAEPF